MSPSARPGPILAFRGSLRTHLHGGRAIGMGRPEYSAHSHFVNRMDCDTRAFFRSASRRPQWKKILVRLGGRRTPPSPRWRACQPLSLCSKVTNIHDARHILRISYRPSQVPLRGAPLASARARRQVPRFLCLSSVSGTRNMMDDVPRAGSTEQNKHPYLHR